MMVGIEATMAATTTAVWAVAVMSRGKHLVEDERSCVEFVDGDRGGEGGGDEVEVGDDFGRVGGRHAGCSGAPGRLSFERGWPASSGAGQLRAGLGTSGGR